MSDTGVDTVRRRDLPESNIGRQLYEILPAVYRHRDNGDPNTQGDLSKYLDACGELLDLVRATLLQRLADSFPDNPPEGEAACQEWLLPYFAQLVDARLVSPHPRGQRDEVANAVGWRQRKGTVRCAEDIAESAKWARRAAEQGVAAAQLMLGGMYVGGLGVEVDRVKALKWLDIAASRLPQGQEVAESIEFRDRIAEMMTPAQIAEAEKLAREWKPKKE